MAHPHVWIKGATGVGKSTFINQTIKNDDRYAVYSDEAQWASDDSDKIKILFIDEASISSSNYTRFEGLYSNPPTILIGNKLYTPTDKHKVVFADNPVSYGGGRREPLFLQRHSNNIDFLPMPSSYLYHKILKPLLNKRFDDDTSRELSEIFLKTYKEVIKFDQNSVLMSPRELEMMAITVMAHYPYTSN